MFSAVTNNFYGFLTLICTKNRTFAHIICSAAKAKSNLKMKSMTNEDNGNACAPSVMVNMQDIKVSTN